MAGAREFRYRGVMDERTSSRNPLRRVGTTEGLLHIAGAALAFACLAQPFEGAVGLAVPPAAGVFWGGWYGALRGAQVRDWFGAWDCASFAFVAAYAVVLGLALVAGWGR